MIGITTEEQSRRLLISGVPEDTADVWWHPDYSDKPDFTRRLRVENNPAWSMGRLWELLNKSGIYFFEYCTTDPAEKVMESLVFAVERFARQGRLKY